MLMMLSEALLGEDKARSYRSQSEAQDPRLALSHFHVSQRSVYQQGDQLYIQPKDPVEDQLKSHRRSAED